MVSEKVIVCNPRGVHLKPAGFLCNLALTYQAKIIIKLGAKEVNAKSVLGVLSACMKYGDEVEVICEGTDEEEALNDLVENFKLGLGEEIE